VLEHLKRAAKLEHGLTQAPGDEARLATDAIARGFRRIVAVGGDGTWSNVGNAILRSGVPAKLALVPGGTGCDLAKTLGIPPRDVAACCRIVLNGRERAIDVGKVEDKYFLNIAGFGYDVAVLEDSWNVSYLEGSLLYLYCAVRQLGSYRGFKVRVEADGQPAREREMMMLIVANARVFGGGFKIAPQADLADGRLDAVAFDNMGLGGRLEAMVRLLLGSHAAHSKVEIFATSRLVCHFESPPSYETDGEWNRAASAEVVIETLPKALSVLVPGP
jgi:diacylglycerol kinase (ATP)